MNSGCQSVLHKMSLHEPSSIFYFFSILHRKMNTWIHHIVKYIFSYFFINIFILSLIFFKIYIWSKFSFRISGWTWEKILYPFFLWHYCNLIWISLNFLMYFRTSGQLIKCSAFSCQIKKLSMNSKKRNKQRYRQT